MAWATDPVCAAAPASPQPTVRLTQAQKSPQARKAVAKGRLEKLSCTLGTEDRQARIAVELIGGRVTSFAYYSKWKPRTCSVHIMRDDSWSQWQDTGSVTVVTLNEGKGAFLIDHERRAVKFLFREVDRERFCGMEGKITGSLTLTRGRDRCELEGVMDEAEPVPLIEPVPVIQPLPLS